MSSTQTHALADHRETGKAEFQRVEILSLLRLAYPAGYTRNEIASITGFRLSSVCGRVGELMRQGKAINSDFTRRDPVTDATTRVVVMAPLAN